MTFNDPSFKKVYELLNKSWMTEEEIQAQVENESVPLCLQILKKGNLVEEQWRMPKPGEKPQKEFRATYNKFRANFQCNLSDLSDILYISLSNDENLRDVVEQIEGELAERQQFHQRSLPKIQCQPSLHQRACKTDTHLDVKGQGLVLLDTGR